MNKTAKKVLKMLASESTPEARVAFRWLFSSEASQRDVFIRLQMLEGAAGVPPDSWWKNGKIGLAKAADRFSGIPLHPDWLDPGDTGTFAWVRKELEGKQERHGRGLQIEILELVDSFLMKMSPTTFKPLSESPFRSAGKQHSRRILSGGSPVSVLKADALWILVKRLTTPPKVERPGKTPPPTGQEGRFGDFLEAVLHDLSDPLGKRIRALMRKVWSSTRHSRMIPWLDLLEKRRLPKLLKEQAAAVGGGSPENFWQNWLIPAFRELARVIWADKRLIEDLRIQAFENGVSWEPDENFLDEWLPERRRG